MRKVKGVNIEGTSHRLHYAMGAVDTLFQEELGAELTLTDAISPRSYRSLHPVGRAFDARSKLFFDYDLHRHRPIFLEVMLKLKNRLGPKGFDVVIEPDWLSEENILMRHSDGKMNTLIGHHKRNAVTPEQLETLRRAIAPHVHVEDDPKGEESLCEVILNG